MITICNIIMTLQTSSLNIAIKNGKQSNNSITVEDRRTYQKGIISNIVNKKAAKLIKHSRLH